MRDADPARHERFDRAARGVRAFRTRQAAQKQYLALYVYETDVLARHRRAFAHLNVGKSCIRFTSLDDLSERDVRKVLRDTKKALGQVRRRVRLRGSRATKAFGQPPTR